MGVVTTKELKNRNWEETMRWVRGGSSNLL